MQSLRSPVVLAGLAVIGAVVWLTCMVLGCSPAKTAAAEKLFVDETKCVDAQLLMVPPPPPEAIAVTCGLQAIPDVVGVILARKRHLAACVTYTVDAGMPVGTGK